MRIALINPNTSTATTQQMVRIAAAHFRGDLQGLTAPFGAPLITTPDALDQAALAVMALLPDLSGFDGVVVSAFGDPGQAALARSLPVPVTGIAEAAMAEAHALAPRFAVVTTTSDLVARIDRRAIDLGHRTAYAGCWITPGDAAEVTADPDRLLTALHEAALVALADDPSIGALIIGGGPLAQAAVALAGMLSVPVVQPIPAAMRLVQSRIEDKDIRP
ncbi:aspartate/glutamate racemase family protein [Paracoccus nototheniae]|uniref:Aspartate/glutamate racemase family protein n=1 Tax=Paracoccus nototheniae TaxID=2489002 RepID=A0ABW4E0N1_9RHOB|nr:aspartate/glutamate racemase family protein [Paracoccus nototheniae]